MLVESAPGEIIIAKCLVSQGNHSQNAGESEGGRGQGDGGTANASCESNRGEVVTVWSTCLHAITDGEAQASFPPSRISESYVRKCRQQDVQAGVQDRRKGDVGSVGGSNPRVLVMDKEESGMAHKRMRLQRSIPDVCHIAV